MNIFFIFITFYFLMYIIGFRPLDAGNDTSPYVESFLAIDSFFNAYEIGSSYFGSKEPGFWILAGFVKLFTNDPRVWLVVNMLVAFVLTLYAYRNIASMINERIWGLLIFLLFMTYEIVYFGNVMRQAIAIPLVFLAYYFSYKEQVFRAFIFLLFASLVHFSAFLFLPLIFIKYFKNTTIILKIAIFFSLLFSFFSSELVGFIVNLIGFEPLLIKYNLYIEKQFQGEMANRSIWSSLNILMVLGLNIIVLFMLKKNDFIYYLNLYFLILFVLFLNFPIIEIRILPYYIFLYPFIFKLLIELIVKKDILATISLIGIFILIAISTFTSESARYTLEFI